MDKDSFLGLIVHMMRENPDWTPDVFSAVAQGSKEAIGALRRECGTVNSAMLASLSLSTSKRLSPGMRRSLEDMVLKAMPKIPAPVEQDFIDAVAESRQGSEPCPN